MISLARGAVSEPLRLDDGWQIVRLNDTKAASTPSFAEVHDALRQRIRDERSAEIRRAYLADLLKKNPPRHQRARAFESRRRRQPGRDPVIPMIRSSPNLAVDDLSNLLLAHGYGVAMTALNGAAMPTSGVCGALRFGDDVRLRADGLHRRVGVSDCVVKLALQVRGVGSGAVTRWRLRKTFPPLALDKPVRLLFEIDLLVSGDLTAALIRAYGRDLLSPAVPTAG